MSKFLSVLSFLRITDDDGVISLTNLALILCLIKIAVVPLTGIADLIPLMLTLLTYQTKKLIQLKTPAPAPEVNLAPITNQLVSHESVLQATVAELTNLQKQVDKVNSTLALKRN